MGGAEHYAEAERLLDLTSSMSSGVESMQMAAVAQVHATLALAAATAHPADRAGSYSRGYGLERRDAA